MAKKRKKAMGKIFHNETIIDGFKFDSQTEAEYYVYLINNKKKLKIKDIELQPKFLLQQKFILADNKKFIYEDDSSFKKLQRKYPKSTVQAIYYIADFKITYEDNNIDIIDIKGIKTADFKIKEKMFNCIYPEYGGLKCISKYKNEWFLWEEYKQLKKENNKKNKEKVEVKENKKKKKKEK